MIEFPAAPINRQGILSASVIRRMSSAIKKSSTRPIRSRTANSCSSRTVACGATFGGIAVQVAGQSTGDVGHCVMGFSPVLAPSFLETTPRTSRLAAFRNILVPVRLQEARSLRRPRSDGLSAVHRSRCEPNPRLWPQGRSSRPNWSSASIRRHPCRATYSDVIPSAVVGVVLRSWPDPPEPDFMDRFLLGQLDVVRTPSINGSAFSLPTRQAASPR